MIESQGETDLQLLLSCHPSIQTRCIRDHKTIRLNILIKSVSSDSFQTCIKQINRWKITLTKNRGVWCYFFLQLEHSEFTAQDFLQPFPTLLSLRHNFSLLGEKPLFQRKTHKSKILIIFNLQSSIRIRNRIRKETDKCLDFSALFSSEQNKHFCLKALSFFPHSHRQ